MKTATLTGALLLATLAHVQALGPESRSLRGDLQYYLNLVEEGNYGGAHVVAPYLAIESRVLATSSEQGWTTLEEARFRLQVWAINMLSRLHRWDLSEQFAAAARNNILLPLEDL